jgi:hypothetical protein
MLHQPFAQLAIFLTNLVNNNLIKHGEEGSKLIIALIQKITKYADHSFDRIETHILKGTFHNTVPKFTPRDANPKYQVASVTTTMIKKAPPCWQS